MELKDTIIFIRLKEPINFNSPRDLTFYKCKLGNIEIKDIIRFEIGDAPVCQYNAGQQHGGDFPCWGCSLKKCHFHDTVALLESEVQTKEVFVKIRY